MSKPNAISYATSKKREVVGMRTTLKRILKNNNLNPEQKEQIKQISATNVQDLTTALDKLNFI